jgi:dipeptidyl aminopeptidase/acylaminoacyl peptidase
VTETLPYGSWPSPIDADTVAAASPRYEGARFVGDEVWWAESVPAENGRTAVRRRTRSGEVVDVLTAPWSARSRVHEYGGGSWTTTSAGALLFVEASDQAVWMQQAGRRPEALTHPEAAVRYGGLSWQEGRLLAVREIVPDGEPTRHDVVEITLDGQVRSLAAGSDFVAQPALSPGGDRLAWLAWNHPDMPWDRAEVRMGALDRGRVPEWTTVAGGSSAPVQPVWTGPDELLFADDPTGRWNLWRTDLAGGRTPAPVAPADADTGGPLWSLGTRWFLPLGDGRIVAVRTAGGDEVVVIDPATGAVRPIEVPTTGGSAAIEDARGTSVLLTLAGADGPPSLWLVDIDDRESATRIAGAESPWSPQWMPRPRPVTFAGKHGPVHAFDYPPTNPDAKAPDGEAPPYLVLVHGGPTTHVSGVASGKIAFFTSRGIGVLDVNYGGSTGYGRDYRERLRGQWGIVDVDDVAAAITGLAAEGRADPRRLAIEGGSAGGWTVLSALTNTDVFAAGISRFGVGDARALAADTHGFESRYLDGLIGALPDAEDVYIQRSPLTHPERFRVPVLLLQGADDVVVPPAQSEAIRDALAARGIPHAYVLYPGEGHGFRRKETVVDVLERELAFLAAVFGLRPAGVDPLVLD